MIKKEQEDELELSYGQRFPKKEVTIKNFTDNEPEQPKKKITRESFIRDPKTRTLRRRGSPTAQRAENIEKNRKRAQAAATKRKQAKNK